MSNGTVALPRTLGRRLGAVPLTLGALLAFAVAYGLSHGWKATFGALLERLATLRIPLPAVADIHPFGFVGTANKAIERWLGDAQRYAERGVVWGINNAVELPLLIAGSMVAVGAAIFELGEWTTTLVRRHIDAHHERVTSSQLLRLEARERGLEQRLGRLEHARRGIGAAAGANDWAHIERELAKVRGRVAELEDQVAPRSATRPGVRVKTLPRTHARSNHWQEVMTKPAAIALVLEATGALGFRFLKCKAWQGAGRRVGCGIGSLLEALLATAFDALVVSDLCLVVTGMTRAARAFQGVISELAQQIDGLIRCQGAHRPAALPVAWAEPPATVNSLKL